MKPTTPRPKVLLVGWDAADWKVIRPLMERGEMPHLARLVAGGASGNIATLYPTLSPMLWSSIATGKRPPKHGIHGFIEPVPGGEGVRPISSLSRSAKAVWNILNQNDLRSVVVGWWPSHPAEPINGVMVSDLYHKAGAGDAPLAMPPDAVFPPDWAARLDELRVTPRELPGEITRLFVPDYDQIDQAKDKRLHALMKVIAETLTVHAAATEALEHADWDFAAVYYDSIDHFCHGFMRYHPPRLPWVPEADFALYQHVIANAYRYHDAMLGRLLELAGPDTHVIVLSDHGFKSDETRPSYIPAEWAGPAVEHRHFGMVCLHGPGIKAGETLYGSVILDIAPTLLHLFGLPVGEDMDGKALVNAFTDARLVQTIPTWETVAGDTGQHPPDARLDPVAAAEAMKQLVALGYIAPPPDDVKTQVAECLAELKYNLARSHDDARRPDLSAPIYEELLARTPDDHRAVEHLFHARLRLGQNAEARALLDAFDARCAVSAPEAAAEIARRVAEKPDADLDAGMDAGDKREAHERAVLRETASGHRQKRALLRFQLETLPHGSLTAARRAFDALEALCAETSLRMPALTVAEMFARSGQRADALRWVEQALSADSENWQALSLAAQLHLEARRYQKAIDLAAASLALVYFQPLMHYVMGHALMGRRQYADAEQPLRIAILQSPGFARAHDRLSTLYGDHLGRMNESASHFVIASQLRKKRRAKQDAPPEPTSALPETPASRPAFPHHPPTSPADPARDVVVVCGLPRSGTSMLMQTLVAGGVPPLTDGLRQPDEDNPRGYFEYEPATHLFQDSGWVSDARGKAVKLVLPLIPFLPPGESYKLVIIQRDLTATLASQRKMLSRLGREAGQADLSDDELMREYGAQEHRVANWLDARPQIAVLPLDYDAVLRDPGGTATQIAAFLGRAFDVGTAAQAIDPALKRQGVKAV